MKGTGKRTVQEAAEIGAPVPTIAAAVDARVLSSHRAERKLTRARCQAPHRARPAITSSCPTCARPVCRQGLRPCARVRLLNQAPRVTSGTSTRQSWRASGPAAASSEPSFSGASRKLFPPSPTCRTCCSPRASTRAGGASGGLSQGPRARDQLGLADACPRQCPRLLRHHPA